MKKLIFFTAITVASVGFAAQAKEEAKITGSISTKGIYQADYPKKASITSEQAIKAANKSVSGKVESVALENEDGYLVYAIEVSNPGSGLHEILVDAGNGKVLLAQQKSKHDSEKEDDENDDVD